MKKLKDTLSICEDCYRHVPAVRFLRDGQIWLSKTCKVHGYSEHLVEPDSEFYISYDYDRKLPRSYFLEITNHCNLTCPHCYQMPDNTQVDPSIDYLLSLIESWPDDGYPVALVGAEPTTRKDLIDLIHRIQQLPGKKRGIIIITNAVYLSKLEYAKQFVGIENLIFTIGLNHPDYQGLSVRKKQIEGIKNLVSLGISIKDISYTLENLEQMEYCINEIQEFYTLGYSKQFRIRCGADIGRYPGDPKLFMSQLVQEAKNIANKNNWEVERKRGIGNRTHYPLLINGVLVRIIQWPDVRTIDLGEIQTEAIADILPNKPPSPLVHQVILRDGHVNKGLPLYDTIPKEYIENYGHIRDKQ